MHLSKTIILTCLILSINLFGNNNVSPISKKQSSTFIDGSYIKKIQKNILNVLDKETDNFNDIHGSMKVKFIINTNKGKIINFYILSKKSDHNFRILMKNFFNSIDTMRLPTLPKVNPLGEFILNYTVNKSNITTNISLYNKVVLNPYKDYLKTLYKRGFSRQKLKEELKSPKTFEGNMLFALYFDYIKHNKDKAQRFYNKIGNYNIQKFLNKKEALLMSDYLIRQKEYKLVLKLLPSNSDCIGFINNKDKLCYAYRGIAEYNLKLPFELEKEQAFNFFKKEDINLFFTKHKKGK